jgi:ribosomal protein S27E
MESRQQGCERHRPEATLLYELVEQYYPPFLAHIERDGRALPNFVHQEFDAYLKCGRLEYGFLRVRCTECHAERLVAFSCKRRGFCPNCGAPRMVETAASLVDEVLPRQPLRQWVLSGSRLRQQETLPAIFRMSRRTRRGGPRGLLQTPARRDSIDVQRSHEPGRLRR